jgi:hypothetical protein
MNKLTKLKWSLVAVLGLWGMVVWLLVFYIARPPIATTLSGKILYWLFGVGIPPGVALLVIIGYIAIDLGL